MLALLRLVAAVVGFAVVAAVVVLAAVVVVAVTRRGHVDATAAVDTVTAVGVSVWNAAAEAVGAR